MHFHQRAALTFAYEGFSGLFNKLFRKVTPKAAPRYRMGGEVSYEDDAVRFSQQINEKGLGNVDDYLWYHTVDLGSGVVTPGQYDFRNDISDFQFPKDMSGKTALDIGSATGYFAFEFEDRGAEVTSVELPSILDWDMPFGEDRERTVRELLAYHNARDIDELNLKHLHGPFMFCKRQRNSQVTRVQSTVYDLKPEMFAEGGFDFVFMGAMLCHIFAPLKALATVAPLCKKQLCIAQPTPEVMEDRDRPLMYYLGGDSPHGDARSWWFFNELCLTQMLKRLGFKRIEVSGPFEHTARTEEHPKGRPYSYHVFHAFK